MNRKTSKNSQPVSGESGNPQRDLIAMLNYTSRLIDTAKIKPLRKLGLTPETAAVLSGVRSLNNHAMPIEIARRGARKPQTTTASVKKMVAQGLLIKEQDEHKKNVFRVSMTPKGADAYDKAANIYIYRRIMASLNEEERVQLRKILTKIEKSVKTVLKNTQHLDVA